MTTAKDGSDVGECSGKMEHRGKQMIVDCSLCSGTARLEDKRCFMGLSERLIPGFTGDIVLRSISDRRYEGPLVDALSASSEILDIIDALGRGAKVGSGIGSTGKLMKMRRDLRDRFMNDPASLLMVRGPLDDMKRSCRSDEVSQDIERLNDRIRLMIARMER